MIDDVAKIQLLEREIEYQYQELYKLKNKHYNEELQHIVGKCYYCSSNNLYCYVLNNENGLLTYLCVQIDYPHKGKSYQTYISKLNASFFFANKREISLEEFQDICGQFLNGVNEFLKPYAETRK